MPSSYSSALSSSRRAAGFDVRAALLALFFTFQVCLVLQVNRGQVGDRRSSECDLYGTVATRCTTLYDYVLVSIVAFMLAMFVASTVWAVWQSYLLRKDIGEPI